MASPWAAPLTDRSAAAGGEQGGGGGAHQERRPGDAIGSHHRACNTRLGLWRRRLRAKERPMAQSACDGGRRSDSRHAVHVAMAVQVN